MQQFLTKVSQLELFFNDPILKINVYFKVAFLDESHMSLKRLKVSEENREKVNKSWSLCAHKCVPNVLGKRVLVGPCVAGIFPHKPFRCFRVSPWTAFPNTLEGRFPASSAGMAPQPLLWHSINHSHSLSNKTWISALGGRLSWVCTSVHRGRGCFLCVYSCIL